MAIEYVTGDATNPRGFGPRVIAHVCNDIGAWSKGFVNPLAQRYPIAKQASLNWHRGSSDPPFALGQVQFVPAAPELWVANLIGQHNIGRNRKVPPIRYEAIREALGRVAVFAEEHQASVHMPRIGCGLAGGHWEEVGKIVQEELGAKSIPVTVYDLP